MPYQKINRVILTDADSFSQAEAQSSDKTLLVIEARRSDIDLGHTGSVIERLHLLTDEETRVKRYRDSVIFTVAGFDDDPRELPQIPAVRAFFQAISKAWPYALWFTARGQGSLALLFSLTCKVEVIRQPGEKRFGTAFHSMDEVEAEFHRLSMSMVPLLLTFKLRDQFDSCIASALSDLFNPGK